MTLGFLSLVFPTFFCLALRSRNFLFLTRKRNKKDSHIITVCLELEFGGKYSYRDTGDITRKVTNSASSSVAFLLSFFSSGQGISAALSLKPCAQGFLQLYAAEELNPGGQPPSVLQLQLRKAPSVAQYPCAEKKVAVIPFPRSVATATATACPTGHGHCPVAEGCVI